jgi:methionyl-tRNA formyltransferase
MIPNFTKVSMDKQDLGLKNRKIRFAFFGSSKFSTLVLEELEKAGYSPVLNVTSARSPLPEISPDLDFCIVASFGKILPKEYLRTPKHGFLNVHPSLLPKLRGPAPIQNTIIQNESPGVTIIKMDEEMDHGPILAQEKVSIEPWPDYYDAVEEKLARVGGKLLIGILSNIRCLTQVVPQDHSQATYVKMVRKEDGLLNLNDDAEINLRKVLAYSTWPSAHMFYKRKNGKEIRVVVKDAEIVEGKFVPVRVIPEGKREMDWQDFLRGNA